MEEKIMCGVIGALNMKDPVASDFYFGLYALQGRGKESAGIVTYDHQQYFECIGMGEIPQVFSKEKLKQMSGRIGIAHTRYSTASDSTRENAQPIRGFWRGREFWIAHNGNLTNTREIREYCLSRGLAPYAPSDTGALAALISLSGDWPFEAAVKDALERVRGTYSLLILFEDKIVVARDKFGNRPLHLGKRDKGFVVASETSALYHMGAEEMREIAPGKILTIEDCGVFEYHRSLATERKFCIFEFIYYMRPDSKVFGRRVRDAQKNMGRFLAREHLVNADLAVPIPDSGTYGGRGFIEESGLPNGEGAILRTHLTSRTFIEPVQELRKQGVDLKFVIFEEDIKGKRVVLIDDSIVRGTTMRRLIERFRVAGAAEVHVRVLSPPYVSPCYYGIDTYRIKGELIAANCDGDVERIRQAIGADSLGYLSMDSVIKAVLEAGPEPLSEKNFCTACFTKQYPIPPPKDI